VALPDGFGVATIDSRAVRPMVTLDLATDQPRRVERSGRRGRASVEASPASTGALRSANPLPILTAAFAVVLHRYATAETIPLGVVNGGEKGRTVRIDLAASPSFQAAVATVERALDKAEPGLPPQVVVSIDSPPPAGVSQDLWLAAERRPDTVTLLIDYDVDLYEPDTAHRLLAHVRTLLDAGLRDSSAPVAELPLLDPDERSLILDRWNATARAYPHTCVDLLVAAQAARTPDAVAVECDGECLTFAELERRASCLAYHLQTLGVGPGVLVGLALERSVELLVGLLGILKTGGAYVPIDPTYPRERQAYMLQDADVPVLVTQNPLLERVPADSARPVCLDRDWNEIKRAKPKGAIKRDPEQLAYVIYTSGSTGQPKGVEIPHRALANFLSTMRERPGLDADDVLAAVTTLSFDIAGLELFLPLSVGGKVVIAPQGASGDPRLLAELLSSAGANVMQATPTTWRMLLESGWRGRPGFKALCGGEALPAALAHDLLAAGIELWNMYGPTETTIWSTTCRLRVGEPVTIGRPIANTTLYILDSRLQPLPIGVPGELHIGGDGLAHGYRNRPDLTAERFLPNPFGSGRIYKTGDLARYRGDGTVEYLGRLDHQVKVRGYRIELGEIETFLGRHPAVASAVCVARDEGAGPELVAYIVPTDTPVSVARLRRYLVEHLPSYMIPSAIVSLPALPLTPNGKIDRQALPPPARERMVEDEAVLPRTALEQQLARIWERILGVSPIGVTDNFFDLGASSLVAAQLFAEIEHELANALPLGAMFRAPTIETLAALMEKPETGQRWTSLVPIQPHGTRPPIFCVHGGAGTILHLEPLARALGDDQPFYGLQSRGLYGGVAPLRTVEAMASHYLSELREVQPHGPYYFAGYCFGGIVAFEMAQRMLAEGEDVAMLATFNGPSPIWIRRWGWVGNQPSLRGERERLHGDGNQPSQRFLTVPQRFRRALREPRRFRTASLYYADRWRQRWQTRIALARGRPLPEHAREQYFLALHAIAQRAYEARPYPGEMLVIYGEGLYEDTTLGWAYLSRGGLRTVAVPGHHTNNRQLMAEPHAQFVSDRLAGYLGRSDPAQA
jgi:amino acid adenylation domain-containing protein